MYTRFSRSPSGQVGRGLTLAAAHICGPPDHLLPLPCPIWSPTGVWSIPQTFMRCQHGDSHIPLSHRCQLWAHTPEGSPDLTLVSNKPRVARRVQRTDVPWGAGGPSGRWERRPGLRLRAASSWANGNAGTGYEGQVLGRPAGVGDGSNKDAARAGDCKVSGDPE